MCEGVRVEEEAGSKFRSTALPDPKVCAYYESSVIFVRTCYMYSRGMGQTGNLCRRSQLYASGSTDRTEPMLVKFCAFQN